MAHHTAPPQGCTLLTKRDHKHKHKHKHKTSTRQANLPSLPAPKHLEIFPFPPKLHVSLWPPHPTYLYIYIEYIPLQYLPPEVSLVIFISHTHTLLPSLSVPGADGSRFRLLHRHQGSWHRLCGLAAPPPHVSKRPGTRSRAKLRIMSNRANRSFADFLLLFFYVRRGPRLG